MFMKKVLAFILILSMIIVTDISFAEETIEKTSFSTVLTSMVIKGQTVDSITTDRTYGALASVMLMTDLNNTSAASVVQDFFTNFYSAKSFVIKESIDTVLLIFTCNENTILSIYYNPKTAEASYFIEKHTCSSFDEINAIATEKAESYQLYYENNGEDLLTTMQRIMQ